VTLAPTPPGYDTSYLPPIKKKTALAIGLSIALCGLALILLVGFLLFKRKKKSKAPIYGEIPTTYGAAQPATDN